MEELQSAYPSDDDDSMEVLQNSRWFNGDVMDIELTHNSDVTDGGMDIGAPDPEPVPRNLTFRQEKRQLDASLREVDGALELVLNRADISRERLSNILHAVPIPLYWNKKFIDLIEKPEGFADSLEMDLFGLGLASEIQATRTFLCSSNALINDLKQHLAENQQYIRTLAEKLELSDVDLQKMSAKMFDGFIIEDTLEKLEK